MDSTSPPESALARRRSTFSSSYSQYSTTSSSSPEMTADAITPDSEEDDEDAMDIVPKIEELDDNAIDGLDEAKPVVDGEPTEGNVPRKRGRPRKHPIVEHKKASHARSKTGCGTCRRRKKKCDETKPYCTNCEKNNVICDGYEPKQAWRSGRQRTVTLRIPPELPQLVSGIDGEIDQVFFEHFTGQVSKKLSLTDNHNPFLDIIVPMAVTHEGLMHSLLYLSGSCLMARQTAPKLEWEDRQMHHSSKAMVMLQRDIKASQASAEGSNMVGDPSIAQTLLLCLETICSGDTTGSYRIHLNAAKEMLTRQKSVPNEQLRQFVLEFIVYHDFSNSITSLHNPLDQRSLDLMADFRLPEYMIQPQAGALLGVLDGLFGFISRIRHLRDSIRQRRAQGLSWWDDPLWAEAFAIDNALRAWTCAHAPESPRYQASLLYRQCTWIYLLRTFQPSKPSPVFKQAVDEGLGYLRQLPETPDGSTQSILLMPLFLLGCAAFDSSQRPEIRQAFDNLQEWSKLGNIKYARMVVEQIWDMMDQGSEGETWDWETIIAKRGWDFLVT